MNSQPKIFVFRAREVLYTILLIFFICILGICIYLMFSGKTLPDTPKPEKEKRSAGQLLTTFSEFIPGIYTTPVYLNGQAVNVEVSVDRNSVQSIHLQNLDQAVTAMFPLVEPSLEHISEQILEQQSLSGITCRQENRYTSQVLLDAIADCLRKAVPTS